ncbi:MAG: cytidylate kinase [Chloroflexi bacterium]|jgi:cytidylate kinase|nr:MAG: cytidylate kinase [Chloroflexota bacterium]
MCEIIAITIDGEVASGKTSVGRIVAKHLRYRFLDTGLMYRALTWAVVNNDIDPNDSDTLVRLSAENIIAVNFDDNGEGVVYLGDWNSTPYLHNPKVEMHVSSISRVPAVREKMVIQQRILARDNSIVMVGRDIGTVVLPSAKHKIFLTASPEIRALRRHKEPKIDSPPSFDDILRALKERDFQDKSRAVGPVVPAENARIIHTDDLSLDQVVNWILELVKEPT